MKFGAVAPKNARGATAVHTIRQGDLVLKKGTLIGPAEIAALEAAGIKDVVVAQLEPDDVAEDVAAAEIAKKVAGPGVHIDRAFTGRANLFAQSAGVVVVDQGGIDRFNEVDEDITLATLAPFAPLVAGKMIATVKIIPFAVTRAARDAALAAARAATPLVRVAPYQVRKVGVISTMLPGLADKVIEKTLRVTADRLRPDRLGPLRGGGHFGSPEHHGRGRWARRGDGFVPGRRLWLRLVRRLRGELRGALVLGDHRRGVDRRRDGVAGRRQRLVRTGAAGRVAVGTGPDQRARGVLLVGPGRLGPGDQLHERPQVAGGELHDVVALLPEGPGDRPVTVHRDVHDRDPQAEVLHVGQHLSQVLLRAHHHGVADRVVAGQHREVAVDLGLDAFATAGAQLGQPELDAWHVGQRVMLGGPPPFHGGLVPVAPQQRQPGTIPGQVAQQLEEPFVVPGDRLPPASPVDGHRAVREHVARVDEQRATIHATPSFPRRGNPRG